MTGKHLTLMLIAVIAFLIYMILSTETREIRTMKDGRMYDVDGNWIGISYKPLKPAE